MRYARIGLAVLGVALLAFLVARDDPAAVAASISQLSWRLAVVLCFPATLVTIFDTLGWRFAFRRDTVRFRTLVSARLAGEAFNVTTPSAMGGEAVKAWLLRGQVPLVESLPSVIVAKTTITMAQGIFLLLGVALAWPALRHDSPLLHGMQWLLALEAVALAGFVVAQMRGAIGWSGSWLGRLGQRFVDAHHVLARVSDSLARFYRHEPARLALSTGCHLAAWLLGSVEVYLILGFLGVEVSLATATVIEAFGTGVRFATFLIPGSLGALEGGYVATFVALGLESSTGLSFGLVRRMREAAWVGIGLVVFANMRAGAGTTEARAAPVTGNGAPPDVSGG